MTRDHYTPPIANPESLPILIRAYALGIFCGLFWGWLAWGGVF